MLKNNPFAAVSVTQPRKIHHREFQAFTPEEAATILRASSAIREPRTTFEGALRWVPWLCAYSGARPGEITQLRGADIVRRAEIYAMKLTPEAGTVKTGKPRTVPIHRHLIEQGFLEFVKLRGNGPLFYDPMADNGPTDPLNPKRPRPVAPLG
jgi:integrase